MLSSSKQKDNSYYLAKKLQIFPPSETFAVQ